MTRFGRTRQATKQIRVWIAGPSSLFNQALASSLEALPGIDFAGQSLDLSPLLQLSSHERPDLGLFLVLDPGDFSNIVEWIRQHPQARVLLLSLTWNPAGVRAALQAGAAGCLEANSTAGELGDAIRQAARGEVGLTAALARALILDLAQEQLSTKEICYKALTSREREILPWLCQGLSNKQIAQRLYISVRTVENHLASIYQKMGVRSRTEVAVLVVQQGWVAVK